MLCSSLLLITDTFWLHTVGLMLQCITWHVNVTIMYIIVLQSVSTMVVCYGPVFRFLVPSELF